LEEKRKALNEKLSNRREYYQGLKELAQEKRKQYNLEGVYKVLPSTLKKICKSEGVKYIDLNSRLKDVYGAYFYTDMEGASITIKKGLLQEIYAFTLAHELKHHLVDREILKNNYAHCLGNFGEETEQIEIGASVFAAQFIFPEDDFCKVMGDLQIQKGSCTADDLVHLKEKTKTTLSYAGLAKRAYRLKYSNRILTAKWTDIEKKLYGKPLSSHGWMKHARNNKKALN